MVKKKGGVKYSPRNIIIVQKSGNKGKDFCAIEYCIVLRVARTALEIIIVCQYFKKDF